MALPPTKSVSTRKAQKSNHGRKVATGRFAKAMVFRGSKEKTVGGLTKDRLMKNKRGKVVSKKASAMGMRRYKSIESWTESVMEARAALHVQGFLAVNGKTLQGKALYVKARALRSGKQEAAAVRA